MDDERLEWLLEGLNTKTIPSVHEQMEMIQRLHPEWLKPAPMDYEEAKVHRELRRAATTIHEQQELAAGEKYVTRMGESGRYRQALETTTFNDPEPTYVAEKHWIFKASYGRDPVWRDVTKKCRQASNEYGINILVSNSMFGDPCPGYVKNLCLTYITKNKQTVQVMVREGQNLVVTLRNIHGLR